MPLRLMTTTSVLAALSLAAALPAAPAGSAPLAVVAATCDGQVATLVGTDGPDELTGTAANDVISALGGDDTVEGGGGNDVLCGDEGADVLTGGRGADRLFGGLDGDPESSSSGDSLAGGPGDDHFDGGYPGSGRDRDRLRWGDSPRGVTLDLADGTAGSATGFGEDTFVLTGSPVLVTSAHADTIKGSPQRDLVHAGNGSDTVFAGAGDDDIQLDGGPGNATSIDLVQAGSGSDRVESLAGRDRVFLGKNRDQYDSWGAQNVEGHGQAGKDFFLTRINTGRGPNLHGDRGADEIVLTTRFIGALRTISLDAPTGVLRIPGTPTTGVVQGFTSYLLLDRARWSFQGTPRADQVHAAGFDSVLRAHTFRGDDDIQGGDAGDFLDAGRGTDRVLGGRGRDTCVSAESRVSCEVVR